MSLTTVHTVSVGLGFGALRMGEPQVEAELVRNEVGTHVLTLTCTDLSELQKALGTIKANAEQGLNDVFGALNREAS